MKCVYCDSEPAAPICDDCWCTEVLRADAYETALAFQNIVLPDLEKLFALVRKPLRAHGWWRVPG